MISDQPNLLCLLSAMRFVEGISTDHLQGLCRASRLLKLPAGAKLFQEGSIEDEVFVISSGHIQLSMNVPGRGDVPFLTTGPGELVGWSGLIGDGRMTATATAIEDTILIGMSGKKLNDICEQEKDLGYVLMRRVAQVLSKRLLSTRLQLLDLYAAERASK
jgi:CRP/FNR family cyclic AMP-dependent transcriptional regulator